MHFFSCFFFFCSPGWFGEQKNCRLSAPATVPTVAARQARPDVRDAICVTACYAAIGSAENFTLKSETLFGLEARGLEHRAPLGDLGADEGIELLRTVADQLEALRGAAPLHRPV